MQDVFAADFRGQVIKLAAKQAEFFQRWQQALDRAKAANAQAVIQVERTQPGQSGQRA
jgi:hypothetical protein